MSNAFLLAATLSTYNTRESGLTYGTAGRHDFSFTACNTYNIKGIKTRTAGPREKRDTADGKRRLRAEGWARTRGRWRESVIPAPDLISYFRSNCVKTLPRTPRKTVGILRDTVTYHVVQRSVITFAQFIRRLCATVCVLPARVPRRQHGDDDNERAGKTTGWGSNPDELWHAVRAPSTLRRENMAHTSRV